MTQFEVINERDGLTYKATAKLSGDMLTVSSVILGSKHARRSVSNEVLAKLLLNELIDDYLRNKK